MGRRKGEGFEVVDGYIDRSDEGGTRKTRTENHAFVAQTSALAERLLACSRHDLVAMEIPNEVLGAMKAMQGLKRAARNRQMKLLCGLLRTMDVDELETRLEGGTPSERRGAALNMWRTRIVDEGDESIDNFLAKYPGGDRQRIRQLARQARKQGPGGKAFLQLFKELNAAV
jgi:ribosome-associated protein